MTPVPQHSTSREPAFGCGMVSTGVNMITKNITSELSPTTNRECQIRENWDMCTDTNWKEGLPETRRPGLIPVIRSDYPQKIHWFVPQDPLWDILFLRLEDTHLPTPGGVFDGGQYMLLCVTTKMYRTVRDRTGLLEVFKRLSPSDDLLCDPVLTRNGDSVGTVLSP